MKSFAKEKTLSILNGLFFTISPFFVFIIFLIVGFLLIVFSIILGIHSVKIPLELNGVIYYREVGYLYAVNWSVNYSIVFPCMLFFMLHSLQLIPKTLKSLVERKMVRDEEYKEEDDPEKLINLWKLITQKWILFIFIVVGLLAAFISFEEWYRTNFLPLIYHYKPSKEAIDWGIATILLKETGFWLRILNVLFDFVCFAVQALLVFSVPSYFLFMVIASWFFAERLEKEGRLLIPDINSEDPRRGFQEFEPLLQGMLYVGLTAYVLAYLSRLQNAYLQCPQETSLLNLVIKDIDIAFSSGWNLGPYLFKSACDAPLQAGVADVIMLICAFVSLVVTVFIVGGVVRATANDAKKRLDRAISRSLWKNIGLVKNGMGKDDVKKRIEEMEIWPLRYPRLNTLIILVFVGMVSLVFYRLGPFILGTVAITILARFTKKAGSTKEKGV